MTAAAPPRATPPASGVRPLTDREFRMLRDLVHAEVGIYLNESKKALMEGRLAKRLRELGLTTFEAYYERVANDGGAERVMLFDRISTNETHFFREPAHFTLLADHLCPAFEAAAAAGRRARHLRVWSAAASTGEEPFSLAMLLLDRLPAESGWKIDVVGTDISTAVLARANAAVWPLRSAEEIPSAYLKRFMLKGTGASADRMKASAALRAAVRFGRLNLVEDDYAAAGGPFDVIFCRNVLIYFDADGKRQVCNRLLDALVPGGHLFLGHAESLQVIPPGVHRVRPSVYVRGTDTAKPTPAGS